METLEQTVIYLRFHFLSSCLSGAGSRTLSLLPPFTKKKVIKCNYRTVRTKNQRNGQFIYADKGTQNGEDKP